MPAGYSAHRYKGWIIQQRSDQGGRSELFICADGIRITSKLMSCIVQAPKFDAVIFNEQTRRYVQMPYVQWLKRYDTGRKRVLKETPETAEIAGLMSRKYIQTSSKSQSKRQEIWTTRQLKISPALSDFVLRTIKMPAGLGLPVRMVYLYKDRPPRVEFDTLSVKETRVPPAAFTLPKGYKKVDNEMELWLDTEDFGADALLGK